MLSYGTKNNLVIITVKFSCQATDNTGVKKALEEIATDIIANHLQSKLLLAYRHQYFSSFKGKFIQCLTQVQKK